MRIGLFPIAAVVGDLVTPDGMWVDAFDGPPRLLGKLDPDRRAVDADIIVFGQQEEHRMKKTSNLLLGSAMTVLIALATVVGVPTLAPRSTAADSKYRVFCANGKLEVEQRTVEQEKNARGSNVCMLAEFDYLSDADNYAEKHGGKGCGTNARRNGA